MVVSDLMNWLIVWVTVFACTLFMIGLLSYKRTDDKRLLLVGSAFGLYFVKGLALLISMYYPSMLNVTTDLPTILFDVMIVLILYFALLVK